MSTLLSSLFCLCLVTLALGKAEDVGLFEAPHLSAQWSFSDIIRNPNIGYGPKVVSSSSVDSIPLPKVARRSKSKDGLTFDSCTGDKDCTGKRNCVRLANHSGTCANGKGCVCYPTIFQQCLIKDDCDAGEVCVDSIINDEPICASQKAEQRFSFLKEVIPRPKGLNMDTCRVSSDCAESRICRRLTAKTFSECRNQRTCACLPKKLVANGFACVKSSDCGAGEICARTPQFTVTTCVSEDAARTYPAVQEVAVSKKSCPVRIQQDRPRKGSTLQTKRAISKRNFKVGKEMHGAFVSPKKQILSASRIVGGDPASKNIQKFMVGIQLDGFFCSGALMSGTWVITARHCGAKPGTPVVLGASQIGGKGTKFSIRRVFNHPTHDITVAELKRKAPLSNSQFLRLNDNPAEPGPNAFLRVSGYGQIYFDNLKTKRYSLRQVDVPLVTKEACQKGYDPRLYIISKGLICAGYAQGGCDAW